VRERLKRNSVNEYAKCKCIETAIITKKKIQFMRKTLAAELLNPNQLPTSPVLKLEFSRDIETGTFDMLCTQALYAQYHGPASKHLQAIYESNACIPLLEAHFSSPKVILVDEYDVPVHTLLTANKSRNEIKAATEKISSFFTKVKQYSEKSQTTPTPAVLYSLVTGSSKLGWCGLWSGLFFLFIKI